MSRDIKTTDLQQTESQHGRPRQAFLVVIIVTVLLSLTWWGSRQASFVLLRQDGLNELFRYRNAIKDLLDRYRPLPEILAATPLLTQALQDSGRVHDINLYLEQMADASGASVIYLMDDTGLTIASSNWSNYNSFIGGNFSYRPYFQRAITSGEGFYSALGTTSITRGFYYSRRIDIDGRPAGVITIKQELDDIEQAWESPWDRGEAAFVVTDSAGVVFISTRQKWLFHTLKPLSQQQRTVIQSQRRYDNKDLSPLFFKQLDLPGSLVGSNSELRQIGLSDRSDETFLAQSMVMPETDWRLHLFIKTTTVNQVALMSLLSMTGVLVLILMGWLFWRERQRRYMEIKAAHDLLDDKVRGRTRALTETNQKLAEEVLQHQETERNLRSTRNELIQAAKLAVLGQMSAGINHELNQPLSAIRSYTENAEEFLKRNRPEVAVQNMQEVIQLTDHMSEIIRQLKAFARKSTDEHEPVNLREALQASIKIVHPLIIKHRVSLKVDSVTPQPVQIIGDLIQLEQVFVNLLSNAIQAVSGLETPEVTVSLQIDDQWCVTQVCDNGEGLAADDTNKVFEPFYTTRSIDQGLGLGLSISRHIVDSLGGSIVAGNQSDGGACFSVRLPLADLYKKSNRNSQAQAVEGTELYV